MSNPAKIVFRDPEYDGQLTRTLAASSVQSCDLGEALATARSIKRLSSSSWHSAWAGVAAQAECAARASLAVGDTTSARHAYLRASEYFRQSFYFLRSDLDDSRLKESYRRHVATFLAATELMEHRAEYVRIPFESTTLVGYFFAPDDEVTVRPTVLFPCGYDSTAEAGWVNVPAALERGYNALVFEGPGQGEALFNQRLFFRREFESVVTPVFDWLITRRDVNPDSVILIGRSFAGYLAPRAAAYEHRLAALVVDPAQPNLAERLPSGVVAKLAGPVVKTQMRLSASRKEFFGARMATHGITDIETYFAELRRFNMLDVAHQISCPTLIVESEHDFAGGSGQVLAEAMTAPTHCVLLSARQGADGHCAGLGQEVWSESVYGWLENTLKAATAIAHDGVTPNSQEAVDMTDRPASTELSSLPTRDQEAIGRTLNSLLTGFVKRDADELEHIYSDDADWVNAFGSVKRGRQEIVTYLRGLFNDENFNAGILSAPPQSHFRLVGDDVLLVSTHIQIEGQKLLNGKVIEERDNHSLRVLQRKGDGTWPIVSEIYMDANEDQSYIGHS